MRNMLIDLASFLGLESETDAGGNVCVRKSASPGCEQAVPVCLQAHIDVVCSKNKEVAHNFETDPVDAYIDGEWLAARGTTLGADDGIGVAAALALLEDTNAVHGPLEALFTSTNTSLFSYPFG
eukprot:TRINITY_DN2139_c0_g2_i6.p3 TRINITY_DN2139_c0_g2~~TRINITY_DN2139_c0_g2_i6.p3  ORF type:complete len:124 (-),score=17.67 TRINITY_DN2139_c0_g2_i6:47-418(-)